MRSLPLARTAAATAAVAGAALVGVSLGGMASVDSELQAAVAPAPAGQFDRVAYDHDGPRRAAFADDGRADRDCPRPARTSDAGPEL